MTQRYTFEMESRDHKQITALGFAKVLDLVMSSAAEKVVIVVPTISGFSSSVLGEMIDALGRRDITSSRLRRHELVQIDSAHFELVSSLDIDRKIQQADVLLAYCSTEQDLEKIDRLSRVENIVYIPWLKEEQESWIAKWNPEIL